MAPSVEMASLEARQYYSCPSGYYRSGNNCYENSSWYFWGRWVLAGVVIIAVVGLIAILGCVSARRRRKRGVSPMYGTGWMGGKHAGPYNNNQGYYAGNNGAQNYAPPPPQYSAAQQQPQYGAQQQQPQYTGNTHDSNTGYYGVNVQQPQNTYGNRGVGTDNVYEPPPGPPPSKVA